MPTPIAPAAAYVLDRIYVGQVLRQADGYGYTLLNAKILKRVVPAYRRAIDWLIGNRIVEVDGFYIPGKKSMGYRWVGGYSSAEIWTASPWLVRRLQRAHTTDFQKLQPVHRHLYHWLTQTQFDLTSAISHVGGMVGKKRPDQFYLGPGELIHFQRWVFNVCSYGRVHTPVTRLHRQLRRYLSIGGVGLVNIDIANSQPLILALHLREHLESTHQCRPPYGAGNGSLASRCATDVQEFVRVCERGELYERLIGALKRKPRSRALFKKRFFRQVLFGKVTERSPVTRLFMNEFPSVWTAICEAKRHDHANLAREMQRAESAIVIGGACARLMNEHPEIPILTIHDSILTVPTYAAKVKDIMAEEFQRHGLSPTLQVKPTDQT
jgi:hypothetical protein